MLTFPHRSAHPIFAIVELFDVNAVAFVAAVTGDGEEVETSTIRITVVISWISALILVFWKRSLGGV